MPVNGIHFLNPLCYCINVNYTCLLHIPVNCLINADKFAMQLIGTTVFGKI